MSWVDTWSRKHTINEQNEALWEVAPTRYGKFWQFVFQSVRKERTGFNWLMIGCLGFPERREIYDRLSNDQRLNADSVSRTYLAKFNPSFRIKKINFWFWQSREIINDNKTGKVLYQVDWLWAGRSGIESRWGRDFPPVQIGSGAHPASCTMDTGSSPGVKCGRGVLLTTHLLLLPRSGKSRVIPLPTLWATLGQ